jgi:hypothetical protein
VSLQVLKVSNSKDFQDVKWRSQFNFLITLVAIPLLSMGFPALLPFLLKALPQ